MKSGLKPTRPSHKDFDYIKNEHPRLYAGTVSLPTFPQEYSTENGLWVPNQELPDPTFGNPAWPYGCTDYTQADLCADIAGKLYNPAILENITHANANGGADIRMVLDVTRKTLNWIINYSFVRASGIIDYFDATRLAIISGAPERRSVSVGTPWHYTFGYVGSDGVLSMPDNWQSGSYSWHNHKICGWKTISGVPYLISKSWQGSSYGDRGFVYISRPLYNTMMGISGSVAATATQLKPGVPQTVDLNIVQYIVSLVLDLMKKAYGKLF